MKRGFLILFLLATLMFVNIVSASGIGNFWDKITGQVLSGCQETWVCSDWTACANSIQTRSCTDVNNCSSEKNKPISSQNCENIIPLKIQELIPYGVFETSGSTAKVDISFSTTDKANCWYKFNNGGRVQFYPTAATSHYQSLGYISIGKYTLYIECQGYKTATNASTEFEIIKVDKILTEENNQDSIQNISNENIPEVVKTEKLSFFGRIWKMLRDKFKN